MHYFLTFDPYMTMMKILPPFCEDRWIILWQRRTSAERSLTANQQQQRGKTPATQRLSYTGKSFEPLIHYVQSNSLRSLCRYR